MYSIIMAILLVGGFIAYFVLAGLADHQQYEDELRNKYGENP